MSEISQILGMCTYYLGLLIVYSREELYETDDGRGAWVKQYLTSFFKSLFYLVYCSRVSLLVFFINFLSCLLYSWELFLVIITMSSSCADVNSRIGEINTRMVFVLYIWCLGKLHVNFLLWLHVVLCTCNKFFLACPYRHTCVQYIVLGCFVEPHAQFWWSRENVCTIFKKRVEWHFSSCHMRMSLFTPVSSSSFHQHCHN